LTRRILLLDLLLVGLTALACWQLRQEWLAAKAREEAMLRKSVRPVPPPPPGVLPLAPPVTAAAYNEIAQRMLFSKDRNPVVVVETVPPPPPPPMPPLPTLLGVMNLGEGPVAILSEKANAPNLSTRRASRSESSNWWRSTGRRSCWSGTANRWSGEWRS
jgi:hypothetical protein